MPVRSRRCGLGRPRRRPPPRSPSSSVRRPPVYKGLAEGRTTCDCRREASRRHSTLSPSSRLPRPSVRATTSAPGFTEGTSGSVDGVQQTTTSARAVAAAYDSIETLAQPFDLAKAANFSALSDVREETIIPPKPRSTAYSATSFATTPVPRIDSDAAFAGANFEMHKHAALPSHVGQMPIIQRWSLTLQSPGRGTCSPGSWKTKSRVAGEAARDLDDPGGLALDVAGLEAGVPPPSPSSPRARPDVLHVGDGGVARAELLVGVSRGIHELGQGRIFVIISLCWTTLTIVSCGVGAVAVAGRNACGLGCVCRSIGHLHAYGGVLVRLPASVLHAAS